MDEINKAIEQDFKGGIMFVFRESGRLNDTFRKQARSGNLSNLKNITASAQGKQTLKTLMKSKAPLSSIEVTSERITSFDKIAQKYGVSYSVMREKKSGANGVIGPDYSSPDYGASVKNQQPQKYLVYFKAKDVEVVNAAFREYTAQQLKIKPKSSVLDKIARIKADLAKKQAKNIGKDLTQTIGKMAKEAKPSL